MYWAMMGRGSGERLRGVVDQGKEVGGGGERSLVRTCRITHLVVNGYYVTYRILL